MWQLKKEKKKYGVPNHECNIKSTIVFSIRDLTPCFTRQAKNAGAKTLYTFEGEKKLGALPVVTTLRKKADAI